MPEPRTHIGKRIMVLGGVAGSISAILLLATQLGFVPVWAADYERDKVHLAGGQKTNREMILLLQVDRKLEQIWKQEDRVNELQAQGKNARDAKDRLRDLESQLRVLERQLEDQ